jgi:hypothetical protein
MNEQSKKAFDFAADLTKQLITLSTSIVTLTFLFSKDLLEPRWLPVVIWILFLLSTVCGLWTLMALTGTLAPVPQPRPLAKNAPPTTPPAVNREANAAEEEDAQSLTIRGNVRIPSVCQITTFGLAILLTIAYVPLAFLGHPPSQPLPTCGCPCPCAAQQPKTP